MTMPTAMRILMLWLLTGVMTLAGCEAYALRGIVVEGQVPRVMVVDASDERLQSIGLPGARVEFVLDPNTLRPIPAGMAVTDEFGRFELPLDEAGAGLLEYELGVRATLRRFGTVWQQMPLPRAGKWLIIVMAEGVHQPGGPEPDIIEESLRYEDF